MIENNPLDLLKGVKTMNEAIERNNKPIVHGADFPGDEAWIPEALEDIGTGRQRPFKPGLIANPQASEVELLSAALHRMRNIFDLTWCLLERAADDEHLGGGIKVMGRLSFEALALGEACIEQMGERSQPTAKPQQSSRGNT